MQTYTVYRLTFKTHLHLGRTIGAAQTGNPGLERTDTYIPADTLFSALCQTWVDYNDVEGLAAFLNQYTAENDSLPFTLTSAFPYVDKVHLFPKPMTWSELSKESKRIQFVSENIFRQIISNNSPAFCKEQLITGNKVWISDEERSQLQVSGTDDIHVWKTETRPRVKVCRRTSNSEIWHVETVQFNTACGLWFAAHFDSEETKDKIEALLNVLGDSGIGGERNVGYGLFKYETVEFEIPSIQDYEHFVTLSPINPRSSDQLSKISTDAAAYSLSQCSGWINNYGMVGKRKLVNMFTEGSVFNVIDERIGRIVDLRPDDCSHPVYRYGYAWPVGMKRESAPILDDKGTK